MKKKVLYIVPGLNPSHRDGASNRCESFINCFADNGYDVTCLALPNYKDYGAARRHRKKYSSKARWRILPHLYFLDNYNKNIYLLFEKFYVFLLNMFNRYDYILADYATGADIVSWAKGRTRIIVNYRGDQIDEHIMIHGCSGHCPSVQTLKKIVKKSVRIADMSICVSASLQRNVEAYAGSPLSANYIFPCCADLNRFTQTAGVAGFKDRIVLGYFGGLSKWQCLDSVIDMAIKLNRADSRYFLLILTNASIEQLQDSLEELGHENYMIKSVCHSEIPRWVSLMDLSFNLREDRPLNRVSSPTKLSESLAAGVPVAVTEFSGDYDTIVSDGLTGVVLPDVEVTDENVRKIDTFLQYKLSHDIEVRRDCRTAVSQRTWEHFSKGLINFIESR